MKLKLSDINTSFIFNKLTEKCICKFVSLYDITEFNSCPKKEFRKELDEIQKIVDKKYIIFMV